MKIVWFSWKDARHPLAGGAETVSFEIMKRLVRDGHSVKLITAKYGDAPSEDEFEGIKVYRMGGRFSIYFHALRFYRKKLANWPDLVIDEMNTIPFGCAFYTKKKSVLLTYQLARQVWFYQMIFPFSLVGFLLEPIYLFLLSRKYKMVLTESESTRQDLKRFGFSLDKTHVFRIGMDLMPVRTLPTQKNLDTVLVLGALRPMKRTLHAVKGFEFARDINPHLKLLVAGDDTDPYGKKVKHYIDSSRHKDAIKLLGRVSSEARLKLMGEATVITVTSIKEGWGLITTEANSQGTPAIAYDTDGLRDSVLDGKTGLLVEPGNTRALGGAIIDLVSDVSLYEELRKNAWENSKQYTFENSYKDFCAIVF